MMKKRLTFCAIAALGTFLFSSCSKDVNRDAKGGDLPTNYIAVKDSSFLPAALSVVSGSSITFVNNTTTAKSIITTDSVTIRSVTIAPNSSYIFKKDTLGVFYYHLTDKLSAAGVFELTP